MLSDYCISRSISKRAFSAASQEYVDLCLTEQNFTLTWDCLSGQPHGAGHDGVSGTISVFRSPFLRAELWLIPECMTDGEPPAVLGRSYVLSPHVPGQAMVGLAIERSSTALNGDQW